MGLKVCPKVGQQVFVVYLDTYLIPTYFAGWCIDCHFGESPVFTLGDAYSARKFILFSPLVISVSTAKPVDRFKKDEPKKLLKWEDISDEQLDDFEDEDDEITEDEK